MLLLTRFLLAHEDSISLFLLHAPDQKINFNNKEHLFHRLKTIILDTRNDGENLKEFNEIILSFVSNSNVF